MGMGMGSGGLGNMGVNGLGGLGANMGAASYSDMQLSHPMGAMNGFGSQQATPQPDSQAHDRLVLSTLGLYVHMGLSGPLPRQPASQPAK